MPVDGWIMIVAEVAIVRIVSGTSNSGGSVLPRAAVKPVEDARDLESR